jgi:hypothetical protein
VKKLGTLFRAGLLDQSQFAGASRVSILVKDICSGGQNPKADNLANQLAPFPHLETGLFDLD